MAPRRPSVDEIAERIELCRSLLLHRVPKSTIKKGFRRKFGDVAARSIERYLARAREAMLADIGRGHESLRSEALAFYASILTDAGAQVRDKIRAQERIDKLMGLEAPTRIAPVNPDGQSPYDGLAGLNSFVPELLAALDRGRPGLGPAAGGGDARPDAAAGRAAAGPVG